jgi:hypothetical protein
MLLTPLSSRPGTRRVLDHPVCRGAFGVLNQNQLRFQRRSSALVSNRGVGSTIEERSNIPRVAEIGVVH